MWIWTRMEKIIWTEHITNEEVLEMVGDERALTYTVRMRQRKCIEDTLRGDLQLRMVIKGKMEGEREQGEDQNR